MVVLGRSWKHPHPHRTCALRWTRRAGGSCGILSGKTLCPMAGCLLLLRRRWYHPGENHILKSICTLSHWGLRISRTQTMGSQTFVPSACLWLYYPKGPLQGAAETVWAYLCGNRGTENTNAPAQVAKPRVCLVLSGMSLPISVPFISPVLHCRGRKMTPQCPLAPRVCIVLGLSWFCMLGWRAGFLGQGTEVLAATREGQPGVNAREEAQHMLRFHKC